MTHIAYRSGPNIQLQLCPGGEGGRRGGGGEEAQVQHEPLPERGRGPPRPPGDDSDDGDDDGDDDDDDMIMTIICRASRAWWRT